MNQKKIDWDSVFQEYKNSGLSRVAFCKTHDLRYTQFKYRWYRQQDILSAHKSVSKIVPNLNVFEPIIVTSVMAPEESLSKEIEFTVYLPNQIRCEIKIRDCHNELSSVLKQLVTLC